MSKIELNDEVMSVISGGSIRYTPAKAGAKNGIIGIDNNKCYTYDDEDAVGAYIGDHYKDQVWTSPAQRDQYLLNGLIAAGIIKKA